MRRLLWRAFIAHPILRLCNAKKHVQSTIACAPTYRNVR